MLFENFVQRNTTNGPYDLFIYLPAAYKNYSFCEVGFQSSVKCLADHVLFGIEIHTEVKLIVKSYRYIVSNKPTG